MTKATFNDRLNIQIVLDAAPLGRAGFGTPLIVGPCSMTERVRTYTSAAAARADATAGAITSLLADYVADAFAQSLKVRRVKVGRREANVAQVATVLVTGDADGDYTITIGSTDYTHTASGSTEAAIATALAALVNADPLVSASAVGALITITAATAGVPFSPAVASTGDPLTLTNTVANVNIATELDAIAAVDNDFYGVAMTSRTDLDNLQLSAWLSALPEGKLGALQTSASGCLDASVTNDIMSQLQDLNYQRAYIQYRANDASRAAWKLLCNRLAIDLDVRTSIWSFVTLVGEDIDNLTETQKQAVMSKNGVLYLAYKGRAVTGRGVMPDGTKIDIITTGDWTKARVEERIAQVILNEVNRGDKVPFDDAGFAQLIGEVRAQLTLGETAGHYEANSTRATYTPLNELAPADIAARRFRFTFGGRLAGAIEDIEGVGYPTTDPALLESLFPSE